jgi:hypothetical protein
MFLEEGTENASSASPQPGDACRLGLPGPRNQVTPDALHYPITMVVLEARLHVMCEKALAMTADQARQIVGSPFPELTPVVRPRSQLRFAVQRICKAALPSLPA